MPRGKPYSSEFKAKVVIESLREDQTLNELAAKYNITSKLISNWRSQFLGSCKSVFESHPAEKKIRDLEGSLKKQEELYIRQIGELAVEANWMKKKVKELGLDD